MPVACEPELMPSFPRYRNMKRKSSTAAAVEEKTKPKPDFGGAFGESVLVSGSSHHSILFFFYFSYCRLFCFEFFYLQHLFNFSQFKKNMFNMQI